MSNIERDAKGFLESQSRSYGHMASNQMSDYAAILGLQLLLEIKEQLSGLEKRIEAIEEQLSNQ